MLSLNVILYVPQLNSIYTIVLTNTVKIVLSSLYRIIKFNHIVVQPSCSLINATTFSVIKFNHIVVQPRCSLVNATTWFNLIEEQYCIFGSPEILMQQTISRANLAPTSELPS